ncbi:anthranilate synthase component I [Acidipila rosea]|uniref:Anthranilate synthase component 1 n=1 Tax=Acidipila rosea TaxID=768535 RepID=A0A4R1LC75_9BACT|nr:anthranilate synthase component I [Acidipila rosea]TCK75177.1 anthranilate synthase component 1 [Acidipila rosea]
MNAPSQPVPDRKAFLELARTHTLVPLCRALSADMETPVTAFLRLAADEPECFLLESVEGGEKIGRYTFIGIRPYRKIVARGASIETTERGRTRKSTGDVFQVLKEALSGHTPARLPGLPPFTAGAVGFFSYDAVRLIERLPSRAKDELKTPDACLMFFDEVLAFDRLRQEMLLIVTADVRAQKPQLAYADAMKRLDRLTKRLARPLPRMEQKRTRGALKIEPRTRKRDFLKAVEKTREYIAAGDIFQAVLSQRFDVKPGVDPFSIYRSLRVVNPSPYMYFLRTGDMHIAGSSPELLVKVNQQRVDYRPIAGTRPRGRDEEEDQRIAAELLADEKERSEHVMLVDLGRNDVGRVSEYGSVSVKELMTVERYSHVMHIVSAIEGRLRPELHAIDAFRACFPAGTLSGAPKVRAMEIIEELEPARRGLYGGSVFYADFSGNLDSCIAIRTLVLKGKQGHIQAGAGIVADSVAEKEFEECENKARAVIRAIERARS